MLDKITFDTLGYSKLLANKGVAHADAHAETLALAITQNLYTKDEVDKMIDAALKRFDERTVQFKQEIKNEFTEFNSRLHQLQLEMKEIEREIEESGNKNVQRLTINIGVILSLLTIIVTVLHFSVR